MRRILTVMTVALVMAAMMLATAMPAFANHSTGRGPALSENRHECKDVQLRPGVSECTNAFFRSG